MVKDGELEERRWRSTGPTSRRPWNLSWRLCAVAAEEHVKPVGALASTTNSTEQMHVPVGKNASNVTTVNSAMMRTTPPVVRKNMTCKSYLVIYRIVVVTNFSKSFLKSNINAD